MGRFGLLDNFDEAEDTSTKFIKKVSQGFLTDEELDELFVGQ